MKALLLVLALVAVPAAPSASVPDPANSETPACLVVCPGGDIPFVVVVRDFNNVPVTSSAVVIDFCGCPDVELCPPTPTDPYDRPSPCQIRQITDAAGRVEFRIRAGGVCSASGARVFADGVQLAARNVASPDQNGNLMVQGSDAATVQGKVGGNDPTADFDCDFTVSNADVAFVGVHMGHGCPPPDPTPTARHSWGRLKTIYR